MAPPGRPNMTSVPSISRLLMSAWAPVSCMVLIPSSGEREVMSANERPPAERRVGERSEAGRLGALRNYENEGGDQHGPQSTPRAGESRNRYRQDGVSGRDLSHSTILSAPRRPFLVSMNVWPASFTMSTVTDDEERNSSACIWAYCTSNSLSFSPNWRKTGTLMFPTTRRDGCLPMEKISPLGVGTAALVSASTTSGSAVGV